MNDFHCNFTSENPGQILPFDQQEARAKAMEKLFNHSKSVMRNWGFKEFVVYFGEKRDG